MQIRGTKKSLVFLFGGEARKRYNRPEEPQALPQLEEIPVEPSLPSLPQTRKYSRHGRLKTVARLDSWVVTLNVSEYRCSISPSSSSATPSLQSFLNSFCFKREGPPQAHLDGIFLMKTYYLGVDGETQGPYTTAQIVAMWDAGKLSASTFYYNEATDEWENLLKIIDSMRPVSGFQGSLNRVKEALKAPEITEDEKKKNELASAKGCAPMALVLGLLVLLMGFGIYSCKPDKTTTDVVRSTSINAKMPARDIYKVYSPEEERAYQQAVVDAEFPLKEVSRATTQEEQDSANKGAVIIGTLFVLIGSFFLYIAYKYYTLR